MGDLIAFFAGLAVIVYGFNRLDDVERRRRNDAAFDRHADEALAVGNEGPRLAERVGEWRSYQSECRECRAAEPGLADRVLAAQQMADLAECEAIARLPLYDPEAQR